MGRFNFSASEPMAASGMTRCSIAEGREAVFRINNLIRPVPEGSESGRA